MEPDWAAEHLQAIRTLMERSAIYRRALAPMMLLAGFIGVAAAIAGWLLQVETPGIFVSYWIGVSMVVLIGAFLQVRRQALNADEPFWSVPTRRVTQAGLPSLLAGLALTFVITLRWGTEQNIIVWWLMPMWMLFYGTALHAAGFFMQRGVKLFGWGFVAIGALSLFNLLFYRVELPVRMAHFVMGFSFGVMHLAYGIYLYFTEHKEGSA